MLKLIGGVTPEAFTVADFESFVETYEYEESEDDESDEEDDEEEEDEELSPFQALLIERAVAKFEEQHGGSRTRRSSTISWLP